MFCQACGNALPPTAVFCGKCGRRAIAGTVESQSTRIGNYEISHSLMDALKGIVRTGDKIKAIKVLRENISMGLKEAKDIIDRIN